jgi:NADH-ubiquinone oxidoreductase chain 1
LVGNLNFTVCIESQRAIIFILPLLPIFIIFFIGAIAETNRAPFDLAEAESELVSGFMTEHAAVIFVFFFLAEYGSIMLMCILTNILFLGGYLLNINSFMLLISDNLLYIDNFFLYIIYFFNNFINLSDYIYIYNYIYTYLYINLLLDSVYIITNIVFNAIYLIEDTLVNSSILEGLVYGLNIGIKSSIFIFFFI